MGERHRTRPRASHIATAAAIVRNDSVIYSNGFGMLGITKAAAYAEFGAEHRSRGALPLHSTRRLGEGTTLYLQIAPAGAYFYLGDGHAARGDGELTGDALETSMG